MRDYRIALLGAGGVGKSSLTARYVHDAFYEAYDPTIEDSYRKDTVVDGHPITLEILDTAGIEQFRAMRELYIRNADAFLLVYDVTSPASLDEIRPLRDQIIRLKQDPAVPIVLVGNKCDLGKVPADAVRLAQSWRVNHITTSAKSRIRVSEAFVTLVRVVQLRDGVESSSGASRHSHSLSYSSSAGVSFESSSTAGERQRRGSTLLAPRKFASTASLGIQSATDRMKRSRSIQKLRTVISFHPHNDNNVIEIPRDSSPPPPMSQQHSQLHSQSPPQKQQQQQQQSLQSQQRPTALTRKPLAALSTNAKQHQSGQALNSKPSALHRLKASKSIRKLRSMATLHPKSEINTPEVQQLNVYSEADENGIGGATYEQLNMAPDIPTVPTTNSRKKGGCIIM